MHKEDKRERLRQTFGQAAERYDRARPEYPEALFDDLVALAGLSPGDRLIEVGCATGKATRPLARRGFRITCVELGAELAAVARQNLAGFEVEIVRRPFEEWQPPEPASTDPASTDPASTDPASTEPASTDPASTEPASLVYAATAWHWIDPAVRYQRAWQALRPGGHLALWAAEHVFPEGGDTFFEEFDDIYDEIGEGDPPSRLRLRPGELPDDRAGIEASGLFEVTAVRHYDWEQAYSAEEYIELLSTFSGHIAMAEWKRQRLFGEVRRRLALRRDHSLRRGWGTVLHVARRKG